MSGSSLTQKALLLTVLCLPLGAAVAAPISPFVAMAGTWSGSGVLNTSDGQQERLRCRAAYDVDGAGDQLRLNLTCASMTPEYGTSTCDLICGAAKVLYCALKPMPWQRSIRRRLPSRFWCAMATGSQSAPLGFSFGWRRLANAVSPFVNG